MRERFDEIGTAVTAFGRDEGVPDSEAQTVLDALHIIVPTFAAPADATLTDAEVARFEQRVALTAHARGIHRERVEHPLGVARAQVSVGRHAGQPKGPVVSARVGRGRCDPVPRSRTVDTARARRW